jgi:hypothetical protein
LWEAAAELGMPIYLHPWSSPSDQLKAYDGYPDILGPTWNWTVETATHALRIICSGVFDAYPAAMLILGHMGELLPFSLERFDQGWQFYPRTRPSSRSPTTYAPMCGFRPAATCPGCRWPGLSRHWAPIGSSSPPTTRSILGLRFCLPSKAGSSAKPTRTRCTAETRNGSSNSAAVDNSGPLQLLWGRETELLPGPNRAATPSACLLASRMVVYTN